MSDQSKRSPSCTAGISSRRAFLGATTVMAGSALLTPAAMAQSNVPTTPSSAVNLTNEQIVQITMVVKDANKVARNFSRMFGASWRFYDFRPTNVLLHDQPVTGPVELKLAVGRCGGHTFKLVQSVSGTNGYAEFLEKNGGEGFYSIGVGALRGYDAALAALKQAGVSIENQAEVGDGSQYTVFDTAPDLGCRIEMNSSPQRPDSPNLKETGRFSSHEAPLFDMDLPLVAGGRRFIQIGLVVKDAQKSAARYQALLGIGNWRFVPIPVSAAALRGRVYTTAELPSATVTQGGAYLGGTQLELLAPVEQAPGGVHRQFLDKHGAYNGFQHLMISPSAGDREAMLAKLEKAGFQREWTATVHIDIGGHVMTGNGDYISMEEQLGGFLLEFNG
jgi:catechol 2,3-dioxygenase-like lactoylglutathione lyase family enzyme